MRHTYDFFDKYWSPFFSYETTVEDKASKITNEDDKTTIEIDLPGYKKSGISITVEKDLLLVKVEGDRGNKTYKYKLTDLANVSKISSKFSDGVLTIAIPVSKKPDETTFKIEVE